MFARGRRDGQSSSSSSFEDWGDAEIEAGQDLRPRVVTGAFWTFATVGAMLVARLGFGLVLARLLTPHEYGIAGMALVFAALVLAFSDLALGAGLVQRPRVTELDCSTVFWTTVLVGALLTAVGVALARPVAVFYGEDAVAPLVAALSSGFLLTAFGTTHAALLQRAMEFRAIGIRIVVANVVGGIVGVTAAALGAGAWALIAQNLAITAISTVLLWTSLPWRPTFTFSQASLVNFGRFGFDLLGVRAIDYIRVQADKLLIGRYIGAASLGVYSIAFNFVIFPVASLVVAFVDTTFPAFSRLQQDPERLASAWLRTSRLLAVLIIPGLLGVAVLAPELVGVLLGGQWSDAVPVLQILAFAALLQSLSALGIRVLTALDQTAVLLRFSLLEASTVIIAIVVGLQWGVVGVAAAYTVAFAPTQLMLVWLTARALEISVGRFISSLAGVASAALSTAVVVWVTRQGLEAAGVAESARLFILAALGAGGFSLLVLWRMPDLVAELRGLRPARQ